MHVPSHLLVTPQQSEIAAAFRWLQALGWINAGAARRGRQLSVRWLQRLAPATALAGAMEGAAAARLALLRAQVLRLPPPPPLQHSGTAGRTWHCGGDGDHAQPMDLDECEPESLQQQQKLPDGASGAGIAQEQQQLQTYLQQRDGHDAARDMMVVAEKPRDAATIIDHAGGAPAAADATAPAARPTAALQLQGCLDALIPCGNGSSGSSGCCWVGSQPAACSSISITHGAGVSSSPGGRAGAGVAALVRRAVPGSLLLQLLCSAATGEAHLKLCVMTQEVVPSVLGQQAAAAAGSSGPATTLRQQQQQQPPHLLVTVDGGAADSRRQRGLVATGRAGACATALPGSAAALDSSSHSALDSRGGVRQHAGCGGAEDARPADTGTTSTTTATTTTAPAASTGVAADTATMSATANACARTESAALEDAARQGGAAAGRLAAAVLAHVRAAGPTGVPEERLLLGVPLPLLQEPGSSSNQETGDDSSAADPARCQAPGTPMMMRVLLLLARHGLVLRVLSWHHNNVWMATEHGTRLTVSSAAVRAGEGSRAGEQACERRDYGPGGGGGGGEPGGDGGAHAAASQLQQQPALLVPWLDHNGVLNSSLWRALVQRIMSTVLRNPGVPERLLLADLDVISPAAARLLLAELARQGHLLTQQVAVGATASRGGGGGSSKAADEAALGLGLSLAGCRERPAQPPSLLLAGSCAVAAPAATAATCETHYWPSLLSSIVCHVTCQPQGCVAA